MLPHPALGTFGAPYLGHAPSEDKRAQRKGFLGAVREEEARRDMEQFVCVETFFEKSLITFLVSIAP